MRFLFLGAWLIFERVNAANFEVHSSPGVWEPERIIATNLLIKFGWLANLIFVSNFQSVILQRIYKDASLVSMFVLRSA